MPPRCTPPLLICILLASTAQALDIEVISPPPGSGQGGVTVVPMFQDQESITIEIDKWILNPDEAVIIEFTRQPGEPDDPNVLKIADEIVLNVTGKDWIGYEIWLTDAVGVQNGDYVSFIEPELVQNFQQTGGDVRFAVLTPTPVPLTTHLAFSDGMVPSGSIFDAPFNQVVFRGIQIDMPDLVGGQPQTFRLYQKPIIPEPAGGLILAAGLLGWSWVRRSGVGPRPRQ